MVAVCEIAKARVLADTVIIELVNLLVPQCLEGLAEWSHCWLIYIAAGTVEIQLFEIQSVCSKKLTLLRLQPFFSPACIIDIKPFHYCDGGQHTSEVQIHK